MTPRDRAPSAKRALDEALRIVDLPAKAGPMVALAKRLAAELDATADADRVVRLAGRLQPALEALGMSVGETGAAGGGVPGGRSDLDEFKARRARLANPASVDPSTP
jgi:hypothetical protein